MNMKLEPSDSSPKNVVPSIGSQAPVQDFSFTDISPEQVKKAVIFALGLPRLSTGRELYMLHLLYAFIIFWMQLSRFIAIEIYGSILFIFVPLFKQMNNVMQTFGHSVKLLLPDEEALTFSLKKTA